jgi:hypothetical protein
VGDGPKDSICFDVLRLLRNEVSLNLSSWVTNDSFDALRTMWDQSIDTFNITIPVEYKAFCTAVAKVGLRVMK